MVPAAWLKHEGNAGLKAEFFNNTELSGDPVLSRVDSQVDFNWGTGRPAPAVNNDNFSARWSGDITIGEEDSFLALNCDDGVRLYVDGELAIDQWAPNDNALYVTDNAYEAGTTHTITLEYYEGSGNALVKLQYIPASENATERTVFIPDGRWIDVWTGAEYIGPQTITVGHGLETSPMFVRSGTIIPLAENMSYIGEKT